MNIRVTEIFNDNGDITIVCKNDKLEKSILITIDKDDFENHISKSLFNQALYITELENAIGLSIQILSVC